MTQDRTTGSTEEPLRMGIVGCGNWARDAYLPYLVGFDDIELAAPCDRDQDRAAALRTAS